VPAFRVKLGANDLNCVGLPLNPTHSLTVAHFVVMFAVCGAQLVPDMRRPPPAGRGCSVESDPFASRDICYEVSSRQRSCADCAVTAVSVKQSFFKLQLKRLKPR